MFQKSIFCKRTVCSICLAGASFLYCLSCNPGKKIQPHVCPVSLQPRREKPIDQKGDFCYSKHHSCGLDRHRCDGKINGWTCVSYIPFTVHGSRLKAGYSLNVYNRTKASAASLLDQGATWYETPKALAEQSDVVFVIVGYPKDVEHVMLDKDVGVLTVRCPFLPHLTPQGIGPWVSGS